jgi:hypothetical protein
MRTTRAVLGARTCRGWSERASVRRHAGLEVDGGLHDQAFVERDAVGAHQLEKIGPRSWQWASSAPDDSWVDERRYTEAVPLVSCFVVQPWADPRSL